MPFIALVLVSAFWGIHPVVGVVVEHQLNPLALTVWRFTFSAACYLPFSKRLRQSFRQPPKMLLLLLLASLSWAVLYPLFYYHSLRHLPPVESLLIVNTSPLLAAVFAGLFLKERLLRRDWFGILLSFCGILVLVVGQWKLSHSLIGMVYAGCAALAFSAYTLLSRILFQRLPLLDVLLFTTTVGTAMMWLYAVFTGQGAVTAVALRSLSTGGFAQLLYIVIFVSTVAYALYGYGLRRLPAGVSSALSFYPQVVFTALVQWLWLRHAPTELTYISAMAILGGTALLTVRRRKGESLASD